MLDALYRRRLEHDLQVWREHGWVTPEAATAILETVKVDGRPRTAIIVGFLGYGECGVGRTANENSFRASI